MKKELIKNILAFFFIIFLFPGKADAVRIKDISMIEGVRKNQLFGYGLVIGLAGTGDSSTNVPFVTQSVIAMLARMDITIPPAQVDTLKVKNIATVIVTADLPQFAKPGSKVDLLVSSIGDAKSLKGGLLLFTPLKGANGQVYVVGQGSILTGGASTGKKGAVAHLTVGRVSAGGTVEKEIPYKFSSQRSFTFSLFKPDFITAFRVAEAINEKLRRKIAKAEDAGNITVRMPMRFKNREVEFITKLEEITVEPDSVAKVVIDERTGTVVVGKNVLISKVAISHGDLILKIKPKVSTKVVEAPAGRARRRRRTGGAAGEPKGDRLMLINEGISIESLVNALNAIGVSPENLIVIFQSLKAAGALQAELEII